MKKKSLIKSCLLASTLLLGTGYAVINSKDVSITGTVSAETRELRINYYYDDNMEDGWNVTQNDDGFTFEFEDETFESVGEFRTFIFSIENGEDDIEVVGTVEVSSSSPCFEVELYYADSQEPLESNEVGFSPWGITQYQVVITMVKMPLTEEESTSEINVKFHLEPSR